MQEYSVAMIQENFQKACTRVSPLKGFYVRIPKEKGEAFVYENTLLTNTNMSKASMKHFPTAGKKRSFLEFSNHSSVYYGQHTLNSTDCLDEKGVSEKDSLNHIIRQNELLNRSAEGGQKNIR